MDACLRACGSGLQRRSDERAGRTPGSGLPPRGDGNGEGSCAPGSDVRGDRRTRRGDGATEEGPVPLPWFAPRGEGALLPWIRRGDGAAEEAPALPWFAPRGEGALLPWIWGRPSAADMVDDVATTCGLTLSVGTGFLIIPARARKPALGVTTEEKMGLFGGTNHMSTAKTSRMLNRCPFHWHASHHHHFYYNAR